MFIWSSRYYRPVLTKSGVSQQIFVGVPNIKFLGNPYSGRRVVTCRQTDRHDEATRHFSLLCKGASETARIDKNIRIFSNLIRTSFCRFLKRKNLVRCSNPHLSFNRPLRATPSVGCMESHPGEHYRQIFQEVLHKQCFGRIRRWHSMGGRWWR